MLRLAGYGCGGELCGAARFLGALRAAGEGLRLLLLRLLGLLLLFQVRQSEEVLPDQQHQAGEHDGKNSVLVLVHQGLSSSAAGRRSAWVSTRGGCRRAILSCPGRSARANPAANL